MDVWKYVCMYICMYVYKDVCMYGRVDGMVNG